MKDSNDGMDKFKVTDKVKGTCHVMNKSTHKYDAVQYEGVVVKDFVDGSYIVKSKDGHEHYIELYWEDTMELAI